MSASFQHAGAQRPAPAPDVAEELRAQRVSARARQLMKSGVCSSLSHAYDLALREPQTAIQRLEPVKESQIAGRIQARFYG